MYEKGKEVIHRCFNKSDYFNVHWSYFALAGIFILIDLQEAEQMNLVMFCLIISGLCEFV